MIKQRNKEMYKYKYKVTTIPTNEENFTIIYYHTNFLSAWKRHIKINYDTLTTCEWDNDKFLHMKILFRSLFGMKTDWSIVGLEAENRETKLLKINSYERKGLWNIKVYKIFW